jgi:putative phosphoesterase
MRLAVLADIHGLLPALEAVLEEIGRIGVDGYIVAGDLTIGPQPIETLHRLQSLQGWMIRGNNEEYLIRLDNGNAPTGWRTSRQWGPVQWAYQRIDRPSMAFIQGLPEQQVITIQGFDPLRIVHGSPRNVYEQVFPDRDPEILELALAQTIEPVLIFGHTHLPWKLARDGRLAFNPGAVCGPLNGDPRPQYALLSWEEDHWEVEHRRVEFDFEQVRAAFEQSGYLEEGGAMVRAVLRSIETGKDYGRDFVKSAYQMSAIAGYADCEFVPDDIWEMTAASYDWNKELMG